MIATLTTLLTIDTHADGFANVYIIKRLFGGVDIQHDTAVGAGEPIAIGVRIFADVGFFNVRNEVRRNIVFAIDRGKIGLIIAWIGWETHTIDHLVCLLASSWGFCSLDKLDFGRRLLQ